MGYRKRSRRSSRRHSTVSYGRNPNLPLVLTIGMTVFIAVAVLLPVNHMSAILEPLNGVLYSAFPGSQVSMGKLGHSIAFFLLTWCAIRVSGQSTMRLVAFLAVILAFTLITEISQLLVDGRNPRFRDIIFDLTGVLAALLAFYFPRFLVLRKT